VAKLSKAQLISKAFGSKGQFAAVVGTKAERSSGIVLNKSAALTASAGMTSIASWNDYDSKRQYFDGDLLFVLDVKRTYMSDGKHWYLFSDAVTNQAPTTITGANASYELATDGTPRVLTLQSSDPEGIAALNWSYAVTTGTLGDTATITQLDNVFTINPSSVEAHAGTFSVTFSVTDGTNITTQVADFTLAFGDDPGRAAFYKGSQTYSNGWVSSYDWTVPAGVTSICVLCIGAGGGGGAGGSRGGGGGGLAWKNHIPVTAGEIWKVNVGTAGWKDGGQSGDAYPLNASTTSFTNSGNFAILRAYGGYTNSGATDNQGGYGWNYTSATYGTGTVGLYYGGAGARSADGKWGGGGGAAGYSGNGGRGGYGTGSYANGVSGSGGGGGGSGSGSAAVGGGGVGRYGEGSNGTGSSTASGWPIAGQGGSGGGGGFGNGEGGNYGGGGGYYGKGGDATVQIIWGRGRSYPNTLTTLSDDT
jgi:hypothetical protein